jgi:hypothetical protein
MDTRLLVKRPFYIFPGMKRHLRFFTTIFLTVILIFLGLMNMNLYNSPEIAIVKGDTINLDKLYQLRHLRAAMEKGAAMDMQQIYPEGYVFFNALYGLSWIDLAVSVKHNPQICAEAHVEIQKAFNNVNGNDGRIIFDSSLSLPYGAFYNGWCTYLLGKKLSIENKTQRDPKEELLFKEQCQLIANAIEKRIYPASYYGSAWPADVVLCVAALSQHDKVYAPLYHSVIKDWWQRVNKNLDKRGLMPHSAHPLTGKPREASRGSSQSLIQCFLPEIISGPTGFEIYHDTFIDHRFGLSGIREYAKADEGWGDIDSGPIVFGMGGAATVVGVRALTANGGIEEAMALRSTVEALTFPISFNERKKYLLGTLPMADVFITWSQGRFNTQIRHEAEWRTRFQIYSGAIAIVCLLLVWWMWKKR